MRNKKPILNTKRLSLHAIEDKDQEALIEIITDPLVTKSYMIPDFDSKENAILYFKKLKDITYSDKYIVYGIYLKDKIIGFINSVSIEDKEVEMGYFISSKEWNKGYATEAFEAVIKELFDMGFESVLAAHFEENPASGKVMQKCGLKRIDKEEIIDYRNKERRAIYYQICK